MQGAKATWTKLIEGNRQRKSKAPSRKARVMKENYRCIITCFCGIQNGPTVSRLLQYEGDVFNNGKIRTFSIKYNQLTRF